MYVKPALSAAAAAVFLALSSKAAFAEKPPDAGQAHPGAHGHAAHSINPSSQSSNSNAEPKHEQPEHGAPAPPRHQDQPGPSAHQEGSERDKGRSDGPADANPGQDIASLDWRRGRPAPGERPVGSPPPGGRRGGALSG